MKYLNLLCNLYLLKRNTSKSKDQIKILQDKKLRKLLAYAYENSRYYRQSFEEAGITKKQLESLPLSAFPTIDKSILMEHFDELVTVPDLKQEALRRFDEEEMEIQKTYMNKYHIVHSSGSTGKPGYFVYDEDAWGQMLVGIIRAALWNMTMPQILSLLIKGPRIIYIAATDGRYGGAMAVGAGIEGVHANQLFLDIKAPLFEWIENVRKFKPNMIIGYPSAIKILGDLVEKGDVVLDVFRVISCGEPLGAGLRRYMENIFHAEVINLYGASESLALGVESDDTSGMYLFDDMNYIEIEDGDMYITSLYNFVQPLIRYKLSDRLKLKAANGNSPCPFTTVESILGRNEDLMWFEDGKGNKEFIHPLAIEGFCMEGLRDYQFIQTSKDSFEMLAQVSCEEVKENIHMEMLRQMKNILHEKHMEYVQFYLRFTKEILPDSKTGKKRLVVNSPMADGGF